MCDSIAPKKKEGVWGGERSFLVRRNTQHLSSSLFFFFARESKTTSLKPPFKCKFADSRQGGGGDGGGGVGGREPISSHRQDAVFSLSPPQLAPPLLKSSRFAATRGAGTRRALGVAWERRGHVEEPCWGWGGARALTQHSHP